MSYDHDAVIAMLTRCSDDNGTHWYQGRVWGDPETCPTCDGTNDAGWLRCPGSQYGLTSRDVAEQVWVIGKALGWEWSPDSLMAAMVNNEDWPGEEYRDYIQRDSRATN